MNGPEHKWSRVGCWPDAGIWPPLLPKRGNWRRAKRMRKSSLFSQRYPLRQPRELAEWVEFLEKYAHLDQVEAPFGGGGRRPNRMQQKWPSCLRATAGSGR